MASPNDLTFVLDENLGGCIPTVLTVSSFAPVGRITVMHMLGYEKGIGVTDLTWLTALGKADNYFGITRDGSIFNTSVQSQA